MRPSIQWANLLLWDEWERLEIVTLYPFPVKMLSAKNATDHFHSEGHTCVLDQTAVKCVGNNVQAQLDDDPAKRSYNAQPQFSTHAPVSNVHISAHDCESDFAKTHKAALPISH